MTSPDQARDATPAPTAHWYFIGATFIFAMPQMLLGDAPVWARVGLFALGILVMCAGGLQLRRDMRERRRDLPERDL
jgi:hypothetical protein